MGVRYDQKIGEYVAVFLMGALLYPLCEVGYRGYSHFSMVILGGLCFCMIYFFSVSKLPILLRPVLAGLSVVTAEFLSGLLLNRWLTLDVWDYSGNAYNLLGQICLPFALLWFGLCLLLLPVCLMLRRAMHRFLLRMQEKEKSA